MRTVCMPAVLLVMILISGCDTGQESASAVPQPRPVTVFQLEKFQPRSSVERSGSVTSWKTETIGFEVGGRVEFMVEPGTDVRGPDVADGKETFLPKTGTVLARLDDTRFRARLASVQANLATTEAQVEAVTRELKNIIPKQIAAAEANKTLAEQRFTQQESLFNKGAATQADFDKASADLAVAIAELEQLESSSAVKEAELASAMAKVDEAKESVRQANRDLEDTILYAPFTGQVSDVMENLGSVVQGGQAALELQMMDPIEVDVQVSANEDARLLYSDVVTVVASDSGEPSPAMVYEKASLADPSTRTFLVRLLIRNEKILEGMPSEFDANADVRTRNIWAPFRQTSGAGQVSYYVNEDALHQNEQGEYFVLRVKGVARGTSDHVLPRLNSVLEVERLKIEPGTQRIAFLNVAVMREISDLGELDIDRDLFIGRLQNMDGTNLPLAEASAKANGLERVYFVRERWRFRPGDTVAVDMADNPLPAGFYVPMDAIIQQASGTDSGFVVVVSGEGSSATARKIPVQIVQEDTIHGMKRVVPADSEKLNSGAFVVLSGAHFLVDGEPVRVTRTVTRTEMLGVGQ